MSRDFLPWKRTESRVAPAERRMSPVDEFHKQFGELFNHFFGEDVGGAPALYQQGNFVPNFEVSEADNKITVSAELPGIEQKDVDVSVVDGFLCVKGEKRSERSENEKGFHFTERSYGSFQRSFVLPDGLDLDKIAADFKNGVLKITLPKDQSKKENVRKIDIKS
ncbi:MAG: Hsp20/alpha crystallin family protein [Victivallaceae bacterium]